MLLERLTHRVTGIKQESQDINKYGAAVAITLFSSIAAIHRIFRKPLIIGEGSLPKDGPLLLIGNHTGMEDVFLAFEATRERNGRLARTAVKHTLVYPREHESLKVLERTGKKGDLLNNENPLALLGKYPMAWLLKGLGVLPVHRGETDRAFLRACHNVLDNGQALGIFIQETRHEDGSLNDLRLGPALLAARHPDAPIVFMGFSGPPNSQLRLNISRPYTYEELTQNLSDGHSLKKVTEVFGDKIAELLPESVQRDWESRKLAAKSK